jgi:low affinity Fe/Cu permease
MKKAFRAFSTKVSQWAGSPALFVLAFLIIVVWGLSGPAANYSDTWQLVINTGTTIVTFLMVFLIQNTQNRDSHAMQLKLDELIRSHKAARDSFVSLEDISDEELLEIAEEFKRLREGSTPKQSLAKLHRKIEAEQAKRFTLRGMSGQVVDALLDPLGLKARSEAKANAANKNNP